jgi:endonuclease YncB( thermonuclease family)
MLRRRAIRSFVFSTAVAAAAITACAAEQVPGVTAHVERVDDGDTIRVTMNGQQVRVRIFGVDAPELDQPFGRDSHQLARRLLDGRNVQVTARDTDPYGRLVASLSIEGRDVGLELVTQGAAWHFTQFSRSAALAAAEQEARAARRGLWALPDPVAPWMFRQAGREGGAGRSSASATPARGAAFHGNVSSKVFHARGCSQFECRNCTAGFDSAAAARAAGYRPHEECVR